MAPPFKQFKSDNRKSSSAKRKEGSKTKSGTAPKKSSSSDTNEAEATPRETVENDNIEESSEAVAESDEGQMEPVRTTEVPLETQEEPVQKPVRRKSKRAQSREENAEADHQEELPLETQEEPVQKPVRRKSKRAQSRDENAEADHQEELPVKIKERWNILQILQSAEGFSFNHSPGWSKPTVEAAIFVVTGSEQHEELPVGPNLRCMDEAVLAGIIQQFSSLPLERIHHFALNGEFMYGLFRDKKLVDILIHVDDKVFYGHRNILSTHSGYFAAILIDNDVPPYKVTDVTLTSVDPEMFKLFLHFAYTGDVFVTMHNLLPLKNLANALQSSTLRARLLLFMSKMALMTLPEALYILCNHLEVDETPLAIEVVKMNFKKVLEDTESLGRFSLDDFQDIITASNLCVNSELDVFWAVLFWVATDPANRINHLNKLMKEVRFTNMSSLELLDCARVSELVRLSRACKTLLIAANWVCHARELGLEDPLGLRQQSKRQCLYEQQVHEPTVAEFDHRFLIYTMLMQRNGEGFMLDTEKLGVTFETEDDVMRFVYPMRDEPLSQDVEGGVAKPQDADSTDRAYADDTSDKVRRDSKSKHLGVERSSVRDVTATTTSKDSAADEVSLSSTTSTSEDESDDEKMSAVEASPTVENAEDDKQIDNELISSTATTETSESDESSDKKGKMQKKSKKVNKEERKKKKPKTETPGKKNTSDASKSASKISSASDESGDKGGKKKTNKKANKEKQKKTKPKTITPGNENPSDAEDINPKISTSASKISPNDESGDKVGAKKKKKQKPKKSTNQNQSAEIEATNENMSMNSAFGGNGLFSTQPSIDPLSLWESSVPTSKQVDLLGGSILQPVRQQKLTLNRTQHPDVKEMDEERKDTVNLGGVAVPGATVSKLQKDTDRGVNVTYTRLEEPPRHNLSHYELASSGSRDSIGHRADRKSTSQQQHQSQEGRHMPTEKASSLIKQSQQSGTKKSTMDLMTFDE